VGDWWTVHIIVHMPNLDAIYPYLIGAWKTLRFLQIRVQEFDSPTRLHIFQWVIKLFAHWVSPQVSVSRSVLVLFVTYLRFAAACRARIICLASPAYLIIIAFDV